MNIFRVIAAGLMLSAPVGVKAQDFEAGLAAVDVGDYETAIQKWQLLAEQGYARAQFNLGGMYVRGRGVPMDFAEAVTWYRLAAEQGIAQAQRNLGWTYESGQGVPQDNQTAHMWYNLGAASGSTESGELRDKLAAQMTRADISEAQRRARVCLASKYQDCD